MRERHAAVLIQSVTRGYLERCHIYDEWQAAQTIQQAYLEHDHSEKDDDVNFLPGRAALRRWQNHVSYDQRSRSLGWRGYAQWRCGSLVRGFRLLRDHGADARQQRDGLASASNLERAAERTKSWSDDKARQRTAMGTPEGEGDDDNLPSRFEPRQALLSRLEREREQDAEESGGMADVSDAPVSVSPSRRSPRGKPSRHESPRRRARALSDDELDGRDAAGDREAPMTSALSDACAWSVGKLKTSAEDWRTGMRLWRPERELAAGHLCIALFTRFFDGMLHAALDPVHGTRKAAIERKARRLQQQAAAQARSEGETRRQPSPRAQRREAQQKEWLQRRERQRRELEAETAERQLEATRQRRQRWQDDAPSPTKSMLKAEGTEARSYDDRGAQELAVVVQRGDEADAAIASGPLTREWSPDKDKASSASAAESSPRASSPSKGSKPHRELFMWKEPRQLPQSLPGRRTRADEGDDDDGGGGEHRPEAVRGPLSPLSGGVSFVRSPIKSPSQMPKRWLTSEDDEEGGQWPERERPRSDRSVGSTDDDWSMGVGRPTTRTGKGTVDNDGSIQHAGSRARGVSSLQTMGSRDTSNDSSGVAHARSRSTPPSRRRPDGDFVGQAASSTVGSSTRFHEVPRDSSSAVGRGSSPSQKARGKKWQTRDELEAWWADEAWWEAMHDEAKRPPTEGLKRLRDPRLAHAQGGGSSRRASIDAFSRSAPAAPAATVRRTQGGDQVRNDDQREESRQALEEMALAVVRRLAQERSFADDVLNLPSTCRNDRTSPMRRCGSDGLDASVMSAASSTSCEQQRRPTSPGGIRVGSGKCAMSAAGAAIAAEREGHAGATSAAARSAASAERYNAHRQSGTQLGRYAAGGWLPGAYFPADGFGSSQTVQSMKRADREENRNMEATRIHAARMALGREHGRSATPPPRHIAGYQKPPPPPPMMWPGGGGGIPGNAGDVGVGGGRGQGQTQSAAPTADSTESHDLPRRATFSRERLDTLASPRRKNGVLLEATALAAAESHKHARRKTDVTAFPLEAVKSDQLSITGSESAAQVQGGSRKGGSSNWKPGAYHPADGFGSSQTVQRIKREERAASSSRQERASGSLSSAPPPASPRSTVPLSPRPPPVNTPMTPRGANAGSSSDLLSPRASQPVASYVVGAGGSVRASVKPLR